MNEYCYLLTRRAKSSSFIHHFFNNKDVFIINLENIDTIQIKMSSSNNQISDDPKRFSIQRAPELCEVLNLSGDLYTVRPNELVRNVY